MSEPSLLDAFNRAVEAIHRNCKQDNPRCRCACGCGVRIGCACFSALCLDCHMNWLRGRDPEDGRPECEVPESEAARQPTRAEEGEG